MAGFSIENLLVEKGCGQPFTIILWCVSGQLAQQWRMRADALNQQLDAKLCITEELVPEQALTPTEDLSPLQQLLRLCDQQVLLVLLVRLYTT
jgi:hypothetical protein